MFKIKIKQTALHNSRLPTSKRGQSKINRLLMAESRHMPASLQENLNSLLIECQLKKRKKHSVIKFERYPHVQDLFEYYLEQQGRATLKTLCK